jgi:two-component system response regulator YesN
MPADAQPILLVDDDEMVRDMIRLVLEHEGYAVVTAKDGAEGLATLRAMDYAVSLVIADLVMPVMSGREMLRTMKEEKPSLHFLVISGYDNFALTESPETEGLLWLDKPFKPEQLLDAVRVAIKMQRPSSPTTKPKLSY